jgi:LacI family transcriptional regulator
MLVVVPATTPLCASIGSVFATRSGALNPPSASNKMTVTPATIKDVARAAGVSVATVSRALNGAENVLPDTRQRILDAARELRYSPSGAARSLITRRTDTIGALLPDLHGEFFSELIRGIDQAARARGLHLLLSSSHDDANEAAAALRAMNGRVDGLVVMSPHADDDFLSQNLPPTLPAVLLNSGVSKPSQRVFAVDNFGGARTMTEHLVRSGRRRIAFLGGPRANFEAREREYRAGLGQGLQPMLLDGDFSESAGERAGAMLLAMPPEQQPDAVFAANDIMAIGLLGALQAGGLRVPDDIALAGFDDIPVARYVSPGLTTMHVPIAALGSQALDALADALDSPQPPSHESTVMPVQLVVRRSCGGPPR